MHRAQQVPVPGHIGHAGRGFKPRSGVLQQFWGGVVGSHHDVHDRRQRDVAEEGDKGFPQLCLQFFGRFGGVEVGGGGDAGVGGKGEAGGVNLGNGEVALQVDLDVHLLLELHGDPLSQQRSQPNHAQHEEGQGHPHHRGELGGELGPRTSRGRLACA